MADRIEDYALIGDMQSAALVGRTGSVDWLCLPRFDSDACFAAILGDEHNGQWRLRPTTVDGPVTRQGEVSRQYLGDSLILQTTWKTMSGVVRVLDFMPPRTDIAPVLIRIVEGVEGAVEMESVFRVRFGYGKITPWVMRHDTMVRAIAGPDSVCLRTPVRMLGRNMAHEATFTVRAGDRVPFVMAWQPSHLEPGAPIDAESALVATTSFWSGWSAGCTYRGPYREAVMRSLITLKALTYEPTGGIVAAATTSLPEDIGGVRNWDYRYCWLRDATITLEALLRTGYTGEADRWREWLGRSIAGDPSDVQIMYGVAGERRLAEWEADWLPGYERSAPVRIGNAAVNQRQLDVYGEVMDALTLGRQAGLPFDLHTWSLQRQLMDFLEKHWHEPDEGIWEVRGPRRHFVHSKVMAWVAFDRAIHLIEEGQSGPLERWKSIREEIHAQVCEQGYDASRGTFTQYYGSSELDAAVLLMLEVGFLPPEDHRMISTVWTIKRELMRDGLVLRYTQPAKAVSGGMADVDGLPGAEGAFLACSFWLVNALHLIGEYDEAVAMFERLLGLRSDVGLLSEEYDPRYGRQVGNTPQAFSHVPLIQTALNIDDHARHHTRRPARPAKGPEVGESP
ncbi:MAG TPA: glycoside hydrolase family 15 protein [Streptosporangiaceae bacterium]|jgi:GH15 family glucan-1,4-alpha-glucosidase|nr:glycoside hydrolase family 15 protein [Streptosporangiaceae bacterium]